jgi:hypothetical protein
MNTMKTYYFPDNEHYDAFFGAYTPICVDLAELERLARDWEIDFDELLEQVHEARDDEIAEYGVCDS